jgi:hypothetical protein
VEHGQLLGPVNRIGRRVEVQHDPSPGLAAPSSQPFKIELQNDPRQRHHVAPTDRNLQPRKRRLRGQHRSRSGHPPQRHLKTRISPQRVRVVGVLVPAGDLEKPLLEQILQIVPDLALLPPIRKRLGKPPRQPKALIEPSQQKHSGVRGHQTLVEHRRHLALSDGKQNLLAGTLCHAGNLLSAPSLRFSTPTEYGQKGGSAFLFANHS